MSNCIDNNPFVSILLVTRNEEEYIISSLMSLVNQTYPKNCYEIIVVDGMSEDGTVGIVNEIIQKYADDKFNISFLQNPQKILSTGWNIGIKNSKGNYIVRIDAHAEALPDFIEKNVETMRRVDAVCVGGKLYTKSVEGNNSIISDILSSPFGVGNSSFRVSSIEGYADTAVYGLYKKDIFEKVGYFNEKFVRNQDLEMHGRIKKAGGKFYFNPAIKSIYYARNTVSKMIRQAFANGKWNMILMKKDRSALSYRHLVPFIFVLTLLMLLIAGFFCWPFWALAAGIILLHLTLGCCAALAKTRVFVRFIQMPILFLMLHISYGLGYFNGLFIKS